MNRSYQYCLRRLFAVKSKRRKVQMREKDSWIGLGHVPPPISLRDRVSLFEKLDSLEFGLLMVPPMAACVILTIVTADIFQQQQAKKAVSGVVPRAREGKNIM